MPATPPGIRGATITGWGTALPPKVLTNNDLEEMFDTSDEWIIERTGIRERHVGGTTTGLSIESGRKALEMSGVALDHGRRAGARHHHARPRRAGVGAGCRAASSACAAARSTSTPRARASPTAW